jgi:putative ABC transport system permease protein
MRRLAQDVRYACRTFVRGRFVTTVAVLAFALGTGVTTAVFSIFNGVLLSPLPYPHPERLVAVYDTQPALATAPASYPKYHDWRERNQVFEAIGGSTQASLVLTGRGDPERVAGMATTASLGDVFGVAPLFGRWYSAEEDRPGGAKVVVLSYGFWNRRFAADRGIVGQRLVFDGEPYEVLGVMPASFSHRAAEVFVPLQRTLDPSTRGSHFLSTYARLKPGVTVEQASADMRGLGERLAREFGHNHGIDVRSYHEVVVGNIRGPLRVLLGAVFLVLLIACANVANLLLASGLARRRELAIRLALGAGRADLARQLTTEAVLLAIAGGTIGLVLATWTIRTFLSLSTTVLPRVSNIQIDGRVLAFSAGLSIAVGIACAIWPIVRLRTGELAHAIREGDSRTASSGGASFGNGLVVAEIAVAFALLVGAGLLVKNLILLQQRDTGLRTARLVSFDVAPAGPRYVDIARVNAFYRELLERLKPMVDVDSVGITSHLPMYRFGFNGEMTIEGGNPWGPGEAPLVENRWIAGDYFATMGIPLLQGRHFDDRDRTGAPIAVLINKAMADKFWPGQSPLGRRVTQGSPGPTSIWFDVIGVVGNVRSFGLSATVPYEIYFTTEQRPFRAMTVAIRTTADDPSAVLRGARQAVHSIDPMLPVTGVQKMEQVVAASVGQPRLMSALTALFAALAGVLAMVGIYGVTAYNVRRQRREFGIRLALGADPAAVQRLVVGRGVLVALLGVVAGALGALLITQTLRAMLHDVKPDDPVVYAAGAVAVVLVSVLACYLPARAAGRVDPMLVLRED